MIDAIYASKLYRTSKRKSAIVAAANDPVNTELVTQLADALSPIYKKEEYLVDKETEKAKAETEKAREAEEVKEAEAETESTPSAKPAGEHKSHIADSFRKAEKHEKEAEGGVAATPESEPSEPKDVDNSTIVDKAPITAARMLTTDMKEIVDQIKGLLNLEDSTAGVNRILVKDSELWIYYNDSINLNNVMANVIESLNAAGYVYLEFNRLARSDNAIVFQIMFKDTDAETKPADYEEENVE